ncbi:MAG: HYR domain-containing protein, partial [Planctomycetes bacterium]|nr:HYR domain-containing protein [Planctomycetota bacterium]
SPVFSGIPAPITAISDAGQCGATISWDEPVATDNCQPVGLGSDHTSGDFFDVGTTLVTYSVSDPSGNVTEESFMISISDEENPEFGPFEELILASTDPESCQATVTWDQPLVTDNCAVSETTSSHQPGDLFPVGDTVVDISTTDVNGNETSVSITVSVFDLELPQIVGLPQEITAPTGEGVCDGGIATWDEPTYTDNCSATGLGSSAPSGTFFALGTTIVTYSVVDGSGNENTATISVTIIDSESPVFTSLPGSLVGSNTQGLCGAPLSWDPPTATDNCSVDTITLSHDSGQDFPVGDTVVTAVATDIYGNETTEEFTVTILDEESPQFTSVPQNSEVENEVGQCGAAVSWIEPAGSDNCQASNIEADHVNGGFFEVGTTLVIFTITDTAGNETSESFEITVLDQELPSITAMPADLTVTTDPGTCAAAVGWDSAEASDNCQILSFSSDFQSGDLFPTGTTTVVYTAQDLSGNTHTDSFQITVIDEELPEIHDLPANILVSTDPGACTAVVDWVQETSSDNCEVLEHISSHQPQDTFELGTTTVDVSVSDIHGNSTSASFTVTVNDDESPQIVGMPADATLDNEAGLCVAILNWEEPTSTDNCQASVPISDIASGSIFSIGTTVVTYSTEDPSGNISTEIFTVTVEDVDAPVIDSMPTDIEVVAPEGSCDAVVSWLEP